MQHLPELGYKISEPRTEYSSKLTIKSLSGDICSLKGTLNDSKQLWLDIFQTHCSSSTYLCAPPVLFSPRSLNGTNLYSTLCETDDNHLNNASLLERPVALSEHVIAACICGIYWTGRGIGEIQRKRSQNLASEALFKYLSSVSHRIL